MSIEFSQELDTAPIISPRQMATDGAEVGLRPKLLHDYTGQEKAKANLSVYLEAARRRNEPLDAESGDVVIVQVNGDHATCKRLMKHETGISLISFNPMYAPINFTNEEIESLPVTIIGKVVENRQKY